MAPASRPPRAFNGMMPLKHRTGVDYCEPLLFHQSHEDANVLCPRLQSFGDLPEVTRLVTRRTRGSHPCVLLTAPSWGTPVPCPAPGVGARQPVIPRLTVSRRRDGTALQGTVPTSGAVREATAFPGRGWVREDGSY